MNKGDKLWLTCSALHNWLLDQKLMGQLKDGKMVLHNTGNTQPDNSWGVPFVIKRLLKPGKQRKHDLSGRWNNIDYNEDDEYIDEKVTNYSMLSEKDSDGNIIGEIALFQAKLIQKLSNIALQKTEGRNHMAKTIIIEE